MPSLPYTITDVNLSYLFEDRIIDGQVDERRLLALAVVASSVIAPSFAPLLRCPYRPTFILTSLSFSLPLSSLSSSIVLQDSYSFVLKHTYSIILSFLLLPPFRCSVPWGLVFLPANILHALFSFSSDLRSA
jgi:hypothetical protein